MSENKSKKEYASAKERSRMIRRAGVIGILGNVLFAFIKVIIGLLANSVSIISDGMNNLTDALSSVVTLIGLKLSQHAPNHKHPLGYGRIEYIAGMIVSVLVLITGIGFLITSIFRIITPVETDFKTAQFVVLAITIVGKWGLSWLDLSVGRKTESDSLIAAGVDARIDVLVSLLAVIGALVSRFTDLYIDGWVGLLLALFIIFNGVMLVRETLSKIIGERPNEEITDKIKADVLEFEHIIGAYDLLLHNYGPTVKIGSLNLELPDYVSMETACDIAYAARKHIYKEHGVYLTFGLYAVNTYDKEVALVYNDVVEIVTSVPGAINVQYFYYNKEKNRFRFQVTVTFSTKDFAEFRKKITAEIEKKYPGANVEMDIGLDFS